MLRVVVVEVDHDPQRVEQRQHGGLAHQRGLVGGDLDRHAGRGQRPAQAGMEVRPDRTSTAISDQRDAVLEVGSAKQVGDVLGLGPGGVVGDHLDPAAAARVGRLGLRNVCARPRRDEPVARERGGDGARRPQEPGAEPPRRAERDHAASGAVGAAGSRRGSRGCRGPRRRGSRRSTGRGRRRRPGCGRRRRCAWRRATWLGSVSWYSSTKTWVSLPRSRRERRVAASRPPRDQVGVVDGALAVEVGRGTAP